MGGGAEGVGAMAVGAGEKNGKRLRRGEDIRVDEHGGRC